MRIDDFGRPVEKTVSCLIYAKSTQKVLLLKRSNLEDQPGEWCMPGGHVEPAEDYLDAATRECAEETGITLSKETAQLISKVKTDWPININIVYAFIIEKELEPRLNWESEQSGWFALDNLPEQLHWTVNAMLSNDKAAERLHKNISN